jgi:phospholipid/cholesterol/gamma-HCH transport system substrate-binding protein
MEKQRQGLKVGAFALAAMVLVAYLILTFSKSATPWTRLVRLNVSCTEVGGLVPGAKVMMAGVQIGHVEGLDLDADGRKVIIQCAILERYRVHEDARFEIQQSGFLGDQHVSIVPTENKGAILTDGRTVEAVAPFNMVEAARSAAGLLQRLDTAAKRLDSTLERVDRVLLSEQSLAALTNSFAGLQRLSARAEQVLGDVHGVVRTNAPAIGGTLSNLNVLSLRLQSVADDVAGVVASNRVPFQAALSNLAGASADVRAFATDLRTGEGLVAAALKDPVLRDNAGKVIANFANLSSNLGQHGIFWKPRAVLVPLTNRIRAPGRIPGN